MINYEALAKHRADLKKELKDLLKSNQRVACVQPTGMGKSHIIAELCQEFKGKKLVLEPGNSIINYMEQFDIETPNTDYITYYSLLRPDIQDIVRKFKDYDYIFLDEMHRALAETWGTKLMNVLSSLDKITAYKLIGFSATPIRSDNRDAVEEIFNNIQTKPYYLADAILDNLLPNIDYHTSIYEITDKQKKTLVLKNTPIAKAILSYDIDTGISNIISSVIDLTKNHKIICFVDKINNISEAITNIKRWFKVNINIFEVHNKYSESKNIKTLYNFQHIDGINILFAVNILNEGVHLPGVDCVIFLRKTKSGIIYNQQLGRVISTNNKTPIVLDLVNNSLNLNWGYSMIFNKKSKELKLPTNKITCKNGEKLKITIDQFDLIEKLKALVSEIVITPEIKQFFIEHEGEYTLRELSEKFNLDQSNIRKFLRRNNIKYKYHTPPKITSEIKQFFIEHEGEYTSRELAEMFNISRSWIQAYFRKYKIKCKKETSLASKNRNDRIMFLKNHSKEFTRSELAAKFNVSVGTISKDCHDLGVKPKYTFAYNDKNSSDIVSYLKEHEGEYTIKELSTSLGIPQSNVRSCCKYHNIKYKKVDRPYKLIEHLKILSDTNVKDINTKDLAERFDVNESTVKQYCRKYRLINPGKALNKDYKAIFNEVEDFLNNTNKVYTIKEIAEKFDISQTTAMLYCKKLNYNYYKCIDASRDRIKYLKEHEGEYTVRELAEMFNTSVAAIRRVCEKNKIRYKKADLHKLSLEARRFIKEHEGEYTSKELAEMFNFNQKSLNNYCRKHNIKTKVINKSVFSDEDKAFLEKHSSKYTSRELAKMFNLSSDSIRNYCRRHNLIWKNAFNKIKEGGSI